MMLFVIVLHSHTYSTVHFYKISGDTTSLFLSRFRQITSLLLFHNCSQVSSSPKHSCSTQHLQHLTDYKYSCSCFHATTFVTPLVMWRFSLISRQSNDWLWLRSASHYRVRTGSLRLLHTTLTLMQSVCDHYRVKCENTRFPLLPWWQQCTIVYGEVCKSLSQFLPG